MYTQRYTTTSNAGAAQRKCSSFFKTRRPPTVVHMTRNLSGISEKRPPGLEAQARVSERSKEASVRLFTGFYFISLGFYRQHWLIVLCFFIFVFVFSRLRAGLKQESGCKIEWLLSLPHLSNASLLLGLPSLHPRSLQSSHFLHFRAKEHSGDRQQGFYSTWSSPQKKKKERKGKKDEEQKLGEARLRGYDLNAYLCYNSYNQHQRGTKIK